MFLVITLPISLKYLCCITLKQYHNKQSVVYITFKGLANNFLIKYLMVSIDNKSCCGVHDRSDNTCFMLNYN